MTALGNMVRVHRWILDEKRERLAELQRFADRMQEDLRRLEEHMAMEQEHAKSSFEGTVAYATFYAAALQRRRKLNATIDNLEAQVAVAREEVHTAFEELKKYEFARSSIEKRELDKRRRLEQLDFDEMGINLYRRERAAGGGSEGGA